MNPKSEKYRIYIGSLLYIFINTVIFFIFLYMNTSDFPIFAILYLIITIESFLYGFIQNRGASFRIFKSTVTALITLLMFTIVLIYRIILPKVNFVIGAILVSFVFLILYLFIIVLSRYSVKYSKIFRKHYYIDNSLTTKFSDTEKSINTDIRIYITERINADAVNSTYNKIGNIINIYFNKEYLEMLGENEIRAVIFHEIAHHKIKSANISSFLYKLPLIFYLYFLAYMLEIRLRTNNSLILDIEVPLLLFELISFIYIMAKLSPILLKKEVEADKYSGTELGTNEPIKTALVKLIDFIDFSDNSIARINKINSVKKRISYLDGSHEKIISL